MRVEHCRWLLKWRTGAQVIFGLMLLVTLLPLPAVASETAKAVIGIEKALQERARAFWEAKVKEDYASQYRFLEVKVRRQVSLADYIKQQGPVQYLEAHIKEVKVDEASGVVTVQTLIQIKMLQLAKVGKREQVFEDQWVRRGGEWYRVHPQG